MLRNGRVGGPISAKSLSSKLHDLFKVLVTYFHQFNCHSGSGFRKLTSNCIGVVREKDMTQFAHVTKPPD